MPNGHIVVVEDDAEMRSIIREVVENDGFDVTAVSNGEALIAMLGHHHPDLVILDLTLPGIHGLDVLRRLQADSRPVPTIVVSGRGAETDRVVGLELGADDYLAKPFSHSELLARVHAVLRRTRPVPAEDVLRFDGFTIDLAAQEVVVAGQPIDLTAREFQLLAFLAGTPRQVFSKEALLDRVWGSSTEWQDTATVSEHIHRIRRKVGSADQDRAEWIETRRGAGYRFVPDGMARR